MTNTQEPKVTKKKVVITVKDHPNDGLYLGSKNRDYNAALFGWLEEKLAISEQEIQEKVDALLKLIKVDDIVGIGFHPLKVTSCNTQSRELVGVSLITKERVVAAYPDLSLAWGMRRLEILYRKNKPYKIKTKKTVTVTVIDRRTDVP